jgi:hypothetical protein
LSVLICVLALVSCWLSAAFCEVAEDNELWTTLNWPWVLVSWLFRLDIVPCAAERELCVSLSCDVVASSWLCSEETVVLLLLLLLPITLL